MPGRCVGPSRSGRVARQPWARRWGAGTSRAWGARRRARAELWRARGVSARRLRRARDRRRALETRDATGVNGALGTTGAARNPRAVWVNGALGEPEVVGLAGCVWVTGSGKEDDWSPRDGERKGGLGAPGHKGVLGLWWKVQAMRAASDCGEESRVELQSVPAGEGPVERGAPGQASWIETSLGGVTGPWVMGQARAVPGGPGLPTVMGLGAGCERVSGSCGQGQTGSSPTLREPGAMQGVEALASGPRERGQTGEMPGAVGWPDAAGMPRAVVEMGHGGAPGLWGRGQLVQFPEALAQKAVCGDTLGLWERGQAVEVPDVAVPRAVEGETASVDTPGSEGIPPLWGTGQNIGMPCAGEAEARCGGHPEFRERGQVMWRETGSDGEPASWGTTQMAELSGSGENQIGSQGARGQWGIEKAMGKKGGCVRTPRRWGKGQLPGLFQSLVVAGAVEEGSCSGSTLGLWEKQALGPPLAEAAPPRLVGEETGGGTVLNLWERRNAIGEPEALVPLALGVPGPVDQEAEEVPPAAGFPMALGVVKSGKVPATVWVSGPECQGSSSRDVLDLWESTCATGGPVAPQLPWSVEEDNVPGAFPGSWGRRRAVGVPMAPQVPSPPEPQTSPGGFSGFSERRQTAGTPVIMRAFPAGGVPMWEGTGLYREREAVGGPTDARDSTRVGVPTSARMLESLDEELGSGCISGLLRGRQTTGVYTSVGLPEPMGEQTLSEGILSLPARRQTVGMPVPLGASIVLGMPTASGIPGPQTVGTSSSGDSSSIQGMRWAPEVPTAVRIPSPVEEMWQRRPGGAVPAAVGISGPLGTLAAIGIPMAGCRPAEVWVTGSPGKEAGVSVSGLTVVRRQSTEGVGALGVQTGSRGILGLAGRGQAEVPYTCGGSARLWSCPRSGGEEAANESVSRVSGTRVATVVPPVSRQETGLSHSRDNPQQSTRRQVGGVSGIRAREAGLGENYVEEDRLRGAFQ